MSAGADEERTRRKTEAEDFKERFITGEHIDDDLELTEAILEKLGIGSRKRKKVLENLVTNDVETWGNLRALGSESENKKAIEAVGGKENEVAGTTLWNAIQEYNKRKEVRADIGNKAEDFDEKFGNGEQIHDGMVLTEEIIGKLGVGPGSRKNVFENLMKNKVKTWGNLRALGSESENKRAIEAVGRKENVVLGTTLWNAVQDYNKRKEERAGCREPIDVLRELIEAHAFPRDLQAYEFPQFNLSRDNPNYEHVRAADVRASWTSPNLPDFLLTGLDKPVVTLVQMRWDKRGRRLSLTNQQGMGNVANPSLSLGQYVVLVSTSGSGKTRFLLEQAYKSFACLFFGGSQMGARDIVNILGRLPATPDSIEQASSQIRSAMHTLIAIRSLILSHLCDIMPDFQPRHWLALQLFPESILKENVFRTLFDALKGTAITDSASQTVFVRSGMSFVAIDEAQAIDTKHFPQMFVESNGTARSALRPLVQALVDQGYGVVLSGTGMHIISAIELVESGIGKKALESGTSQIYGTTSEIYGTTTVLDSAAVKCAVRERGYVRGGIEPYACELFSGRPRFAMNLAATLLTQGDWRQTAKRIEEDLYNAASKLEVMPATSVPSGLKRVLPELAFTATEYTLKGLGGISANGEVALEVGACAVSFSKRMRSLADEEDESIRRAFCIEEPLVIRTLRRFGDQAFLELLNEREADIGTKFEDYIAVHAELICSALDQIAKDKVGDGYHQFEQFRGPWVVPEPGGDMRCGIRVKNALDASALHNIVEGLKAEYGVSLLFPCAGFGADVVIVAKRKGDGKILLVLLQCKACMKVSTPQAMKSLTLPYHQNRDKRNPTVPDRYAQPLKDLQKILERPNVCVAFVVFKFPAKSQSNVPEAEIVNFKLPTVKSAKTIKVMKVVLDHRNAEERLPGLKAGLRAMEEVKNAKTDLFRDD